MTRSEYIEWCKVRARFYLDSGDLPSAVASMISDMNNRDDTTVNVFIVGLGTMSAMNRDTKRVRSFIEGFS